MKTFECEGVVHQIPDVAFYKDTEHGPTFEVLEGEWKGLKFGYADLRFDDEQSISYQPIIEQGTKGVDIKNIEPLLNSYLLYMVLESVAALEKEIKNEDSSAE